MISNFVKQNVKWFSQGCLKINCGNILYTDPFGIDKAYNDADFILITHGHYDHFSPEDICKVVKENTVFVFPNSMRNQAEEYKQYKILFVEPGSEFMLSESIKIFAKYAYNIKKVKCHPKENNWVGYVIDVNGIKLYYTSDTELIPEMKDITADVIFVPLGQVYTMNSVEDAAKAVEETKAKVAVPIHFGMAEGTKEDAEKFISLLKGKAEAFLL